MYICQIACIQNVYAWNKGRNHYHLNYYHAFNWMCMHEIKTVMLVKAKEKYIDPTIYIIIIYEN
jgi:hypothetical protein